MLPCGDKSWISSLGVVCLIVYYIMSLFTTIESLECFACHDVKSKFRCRTTMICDSGEVCLAQKVYSSFEDQAGEMHKSVYYNMACKKRADCVNDYSSATKFDVHSRYISACCCSNRCLEEDGTGYGDYSNCYNALTYEEAWSRTTSDSNLCFCDSYLVLLLSLVLYKVCCIWWWCMTVLYM